MGTGDGITRIATQSGDTVDIVTGCALEVTRSRNITVYAFKPVLWVSERGLDVVGYSYNDRSTFVTRKLCTDLT